ncbi:MAG: isoprenyl transferase [Antricoccus sp.]
MGDVKVGFRRLIAKSRKQLKRMLSPALYTAYESRVLVDLEHVDIPRHVAVIIDGNRRWAREMGFEVAHGHRKGGERLIDLVTWSEQIGVEVVTIWMLSNDNLTNRPAAELSPLMDVIVDVSRWLSEPQRNWRVRVMGLLDLLPDQIAADLRDSASLTDTKSGITVNIAVGYGGREEIVEAIRAVLREAQESGQSLSAIAEQIDLVDIENHLYTKGQPDPDLIIRTSGEQRLGGFMLWQGAKSEYYFSDVYWPDFRRVDFLRAIREFAYRNRRYGA